MALGAAAVATLGLAACGSGTSSKGTTTGGGTDTPVKIETSAASSLSGGNDIAGKQILFIHANDSGNTFDAPAVSGSEAAAGMAGLKLDTQFTDNDNTKLRTAFQAGITKKVAGIVVSIPDASLNKPVCAAQKAGIPVIAWNQNGVTGPAKSCVLAYVGQDFVSSGKAIGQRMVEAGAIKQGDKVFCPVEYANATYADQRSEGINQALQAVGAKCDVVGVGADEAKARSTEAQYLLGHRDTKAILGLGGPSQGVAEAAVKQAKLDGIAIGGFDLNPAIVDGLKAGTTTATVDQQPYSQGFMSVMQVALYLKYGLFPSNIPTGGTGLVDKSNIGLVSSLVPKYR
jgi:simple sugar transport system substrate-binding protein